MSTTTRPGQKVTSAKRPLSPNSSRLRSTWAPKESLLTIDDWLALRDVKPPYELIAGKLVQKMVTTNQHDWAVRKFAVMCDQWCDEQGWKIFSQGPGTQLDEHSGYIPDVMLFSPATPINPAASRNPAPFLAVEVLSRGTSRLDRGEKKRTYAHAEVQIYILIDTTSRTMEVFRLQNQHYGSPEILKTDEVWQPAELPGLRLELARLWM
jgi:Uma2 family endonuclease